MKYVIAMVTGGIMVTTSFLAGGFCGVMLGYAIYSKDKTKNTED